MISGTERYRTVDHQERIERIGKVYIYILRYCLATVLSLYEVVTCSKIFKYIKVFIITCLKLHCFFKRSGSSRSRCFLIEAESKREIHFLTCYINSYHTCSTSLVANHWVYDRVELNKIGNRNFLIEITLPTPARHSWIGCISLIHRSRFRLEISIIIKTTGFYPIFTSK